MGRRAMPRAVSAAAMAWVAAAAIVLVTHGLLDTEHLLAPYMGIVIYLPFWLVGLWAVLLLLRGAGRVGQAVFALVGAVLAGFASFIFLTSLGSTPGTNPEGFGALLLAVLSVAAFIAALRPRPVAQAA